MLVRLRPRVVLVGCIIIEIVMTPYLRARENVILASVDDEKGGPRPCYRALSKHIWLVSFERRLQHEIHHSFLRVGASIDSARSRIGWPSVYLSMY